MKRILLLLMLLAPLSLLAQLNIDNIDVVTSTCAANGEITIHVSGATGSIRYYYKGLDANNSQKKGEQQDNPVFTGMIPGNYQVDVYANGITVSKNIFIPTTYVRFELVSIKVDDTEDPCVESGEISINVKAGLPPYTYTVKETSLPQRTLISNTTSATFSNLEAGSYKVTILDNCGTTVGSASNLTVTSSGAPLAGINFTQFSTTVAVTGGGGCQNLDLSLSALKINNSTTIGNFRPLWYRIEYPLGTMGSWVKTTAADITAHINNYSKDDLKYKIWVRNTCTNTEIASAQMTLPEDKISFTVTPTSISYIDNCTPPISGAIINMNSSIPDYFCDQYFPINITVTDNAGVEASRNYTWNFNSSFPLEGLTPNKTYTLNISGGSGIYAFTTTQTVTPKTPSNIPTTPVTITQLGTYINKSSRQNPVNYNTQNCDFATAAMYVAKANVPTSDANTSNLGPIGFKILSAPQANGGDGTALVGRQMTLASIDYSILNTSSMSYAWPILWTDLPFGVYQIEIDYGCRIEQLNVNFQPEIKGFTASDPVITEAATCGTYNLETRAYFTKNDNSAWNISYPSLRFYVDVFDENGTFVVRSNAGYSSPDVTSNAGLAVVKGLVAGKYTLKYRSINSQAPYCYLATKDVDLAKVEPLTIDVSQSGGFFCTSAKVTFADMTIVATGGRMFNDLSGSHYQYRIKQKDQPDSNYRPWQNSNVFPTVDFLYNYIAQVMDNCGTIVSQELRIFSGAGSFTTTSGSYCEGTKVTLEVVSLGQVSSYAWYKDGVLLPAETGPKLEITSYKQSDLGTYTVTIHNLTCEVSDNITLTQFNPLPAQLAITGECTYQGASVSLAASPFPGITYTWYRNGILLQDTGSNNTLNVNQAGIYTVYATNSKGCISPASSPFILSLPVMYWNDRMNNNNWNDVRNWNDANGNAANTLPNACTTVHIPGNVTKYPALDVINTNRTPYGNPTVDNIVYHFGGETAFPHLLTYNKAFVQYNWGYYGSGISSATINSQPTLNGDIYSSMPMSRNHWHTLAAPLKKMTSGDFALAGRPFTWQAVYNMNNPQTGELITADFSKSFATNDIDLSTQNNALAIKLAPYNTLTGYNNHRDLEGLNGVLEFPYFENTSIAPYRPAQIYSPLLGESRFYYFNTKTLNLLNSPIGRIKRKDEAYRFVFENSSNATDIITVNSQSVPGYKIAVSTNNPLREVLIGNPFMSSINSQKFLEANSASIVSTGYKTYNSSSDTWTLWSFSTTNNIGPLQAFVVTLSNSTADLLFPLEGASALTGANYEGGFMQKSVTSGLSVKVSDSDDRSGDNATLYNIGKTTDSSINNVPSVISSENNSSPEVFFISHIKNEFNTIQMISGDTKEICLGFKTSNKRNSNLQLEFKNVNQYAFDNKVYPVLIDKTLGVSQDLLANNIYLFNENGSIKESYYINKNRFVLMLVNSELEKNKLLESEILITCSQNELKVVAKENIRKVCIYDLNGRLVYNSRQNNNHMVYTQNIDLTGGVYIVKVDLESKKTENAKIIIE